MYRISRWDAGRGDVVWTRKKKRDWVDGFDSWTLKVPCFLLSWSGYIWKVAMLACGLESSDISLFGNFFFFLLVIGIHPLPLPVTLGWDLHTN